jgi:hypothetical protein
VVSITGGSVIGIMELDGVLCNAGRIALRRLTLNHMGVTNGLTQQLDVIEFILTIVSAPYKDIFRSNLQKENFLSI